MTRHSSAASEAGRPPLPLTLLVTWGGAGLSPIAPGTFGSLAALPFAYLIAMTTGSWGLVAAAAIVFLIGWWASDAYCASTCLKDPGLIVIDEVAAQWLVLAVAPAEIGPYIAGFALFRLFDTLKPWPIRWLDRHIAGGLGVMVDDILAALFAIPLLLILLHYWSA